MRRTEPDLFTYRLIVTCWPPDTEDLQTLVPSARVHALDLMEREPLDVLTTAEHHTAIARRLPDPWLNPTTSVIIVLVVMFLRRH